jgi:hypothetical protein
MDRPDFMGLYESYLGVYEEVESIEEDVEEIDEGIRQGIRRGIRAARNAVGDLADKAEYATYTKAEKRELGNKKHEFRNTPEGHNAIMRRNKDRQGKYNEEVDLYDLVLEYLLDEGLCESVENAEIMMAHMSEGWVDAILEVTGGGKVEYKPVFRGTSERPGHRIYPKKEEDPEKRGMDYPGHKTANKINQLAYERSNTPKSRRSKLDKRISKLQARFDKDGGEYQAYSG